MNYPKKYFEQIESGKIVANREITAFYKRICGEMGDRSNPYQFSEKYGSHAIKFIEKFCRHYQGKKAGQLVKLDLFQKAFIQTLFGWIDRKTKLRRFREYFFEVPRKHGKSFLSGCIAVYMMVADGEKGAEIYTAATKLDQAKIIYNVARNIIDQSPELREYIRTTRDGIYFDAYRSVIKPLPNESKSLDGLNIHFAALDEVHELRDRNMYDVLRQGMKGRRQPLIGCITTSGFRREGLYDNLHDYASAVALGTIIDDHFLPIIYKLDDVDEWTDERMWEKANPGLGSIKDINQLRDDVERAKKDPQYLPTLLTKDFNMKQSENAAWLPLEYIINANTVDMNYLKHSYAIGGCDLSSTTDLTCATLLIRKPGDPHIYVLQKYFLPMAKIEKLEQTESKEAPYKLWSEQGWVDINEGAQVDYHAVTLWFLKMVREYDIRPLWICYDRALAGYWVAEMEGCAFNLERTAQGPFTWSQPMKEMGAAFEDHMVVYQNNPVLRWCLANTAKKSLNNDGIETIQPIKIQKSRRIDGTVSLLNAWVGYVKHYNEYMKFLR